MASTGPNHLVLVVEDDAELSLSVVEALQNAGYETASVGDGRLALDVLQHAVRPVLVLLDLSLPVVSGFELMELISRDRTLPPLDVVIMTGGMTANGLLGGAQILQKPFTQEELLEVVSSYARPVRPPSEG